MNDEQFWDTYLSSMEDLSQEPPPEVKERVFRKMRREQRRKRWMRRGALGFLGLLLLGSGSLLWNPFRTDETFIAGNDEEALHVWDAPLSQLEDDLEARSGSAELVDEKEGKSLEARNEQEEKGAERKDRNGASDQKLDRRVPPTNNRSGEQRAGGSEQDGSQEGGRKSLAEAREQEEEASLKKEEKLEKGSIDEAEATAADGQKATKKGGNKLRSLPARIPQVDEPESLILTSSNGGGAEGESTEWGDPRFFVGSDMTFNFTRLLDEHAKESFSSGSLVSTEGELYFDMSLTAGLRLGDRTRLLGRYFMKKDVGQQVYRYVEGRYKAQGIRLSYRNYELMLEHDLAEHRIDDASSIFLSAYLGGHMGSLRKAERSEKSEALNVQDDFKDRNFGLQGGLRAGFANDKGFDVGLLFGASGGLSNNRAEDPELSLLEGPARNISVGTGLSLRYHFGSRSPIDQ